MYLEELITIKSGKRLPKGVMLIQTPNSHPYIKVKDMSDYILNITESFEYVDDNTFTKISNYTVDKDDIILSIVGTIGNVCMIGNSLHKASLTENCVKLIPKDNRILKKYLYYFLKSSNGQKEIEKGIIGSTQPKLPFYNIDKINIPILDIQSQQHIVDTIGSIDDLIENNNTIIIKLENIILNLYRKKSIEWKKQVKIGDLFKCILGGTPSTKKNEYWDGDIAWVNSGEVNKLRIVSPSRYITKDGLENSATKLLPKKTTVIAITGATLGQVSLLEIDSCTNQSVIGILENNTLKHDFIYPMMINAIKKLVLNKTGGAQQHINKNDVETFEIFVPSEIEYFEYSQIVQPIFEYQSKLILQNKELLLLKNKYLQKFFA